MKFSVDELLQAGSHKWNKKDVDTVTLRNLEDLCRKINALGYTPPMYASSCLRSLADQKRINPKAMGSSHLYGCAVDVVDKDGALGKYVKQPAIKLMLADCGLWVENPEKTPGWVHFQTLAPKSMSRIFNP